MAYDIKLHWDECAWVARFNTPGGPDCCSQAETAYDALIRLGKQLEFEVEYFAGVDNIPTLPASAVTPDKEG